MELRLLSVEMKMIKMIKITINNNNKPIIKYIIIIINNTNKILYKK